ncbi:nucleotide excision repair TFIIH subunit [Serendipita vermifera]|nr:nucleotide excision repair TFIIH subunit [Serendipita vermifera]
MKAVKGVLITCDAAVKQILLQMNERRRDEDAFVIEDLDQTHILIKADQEESMRQELEIELEKNTYTVDA